MTYVSSSFVYDGHYQGTISEDMVSILPAPDNGYGLEKRMAEVAIEAAHNELGLPYTIMRVFNCVGIRPPKMPADGEPESGSSKNHVIDDLFIKCKQSSTVELFGDGSQERAFTYAADIAKGIADSLNNPSATNEIFNLSSSESTTIQNLAEKIFDIVRPGEIPDWRYSTAAKSDKKKRLTNTEKARKELGFEATVPLEEILQLFR